MHQSRYDKASALMMLDEARKLVTNTNDEGAVVRAKRTLEAIFDNLFGKDSIYHQDLNRFLVTSFTAAYNVKYMQAILGAAEDEVRLFWNGQKEAEVIHNAANSPPDLSLVFVIYGRQKLEDMYAFLRAIGLKPFEWGQARKYTAAPNPYTWQIVDTALTKAGAIVALMTADDEARLRENLWTSTENSVEKEYLHQPRQNVTFEAGVAYGRAPERTVLVRIGQQRPMSDLAGHHILQLNNSPESRQAFADALKAAGCPVDLSGSSWFRAGDFS